MLWLRVKLHIVKVSLNKSLWNRFQMDSRWIQIMMKFQDLHGKYIQLWRLWFFSICAAKRAHQCTYLIKHNQILRKKSKTIFKSQLCRHSPNFIVLSMSTSILGANLSQNIHSSQTWHFFGGRVCTVVYMFVAPQILMLTSYCPVWWY